MSPLYGRKDKSAKAETHRIEEAVAALYPLAPFASLACGKRTLPTHYTATSCLKRTWRYLCAERNLYSWTNEPAVCAEIFNLLNQANFNTPNSIVFTFSGVSGTVGAITSTSITSRQVQIRIEADLVGNAFTARFEPKLNLQIEPL
jgi:hypothetical protein